MAGLITRCLGAARLDAATYEDVEADEGVTGQAMLVVALSSIAAGIGAADQAGVSGIVGGTVVAVIAWFVWAGLVTLIGTRLLPEATTRADLGQVIRTTGFSASPGMLQVFGIIPGIGPVVGIVTNLWMLAAMVVAVRQALDYAGIGRAILVTFLGFVAFVGVLVVLGTFLGIGIGVVEGLHPGAQAQGG
jgi:hypothetical protein